MEQLKFISESGIVVSTVKLHFTRGYETMIFNKYGDAIFSRKYYDKDSAIKGHNFYVEQNSK